MVFSADYSPDVDNALVGAALAGDAQSLQLLIKRHQDYVYNVSLKLFSDPEDAQDATQEVLIKVVTNLKSFRGDSQFRTWLYRIAFNHFLNAPPKKTEQLLEAHASASRQWSEDTAPEVSEEEIEEVRILCATAMLMCLNREQRLLYIVGEVFGADHRLGAELFEITPANYRVKLHRAKADLLNFVAGRCGLINPDNPCRCPKKARALVQQGVVDKEHLRFSTDYHQKISDLVTERKDEVSDKVQLDLQALFQDSPFQVKREVDALIGGLVASTRHQSAKKGD